LETQIDSLIVKKYGMDAGASVVGIAAACDFFKAPNGFKPTDILEGCLSVIVFGSPFSKEVLNNTVDYTETRNIMLKKMTEIAEEVAKRIKTDGHKTKAISGSGGKFYRRQSLWSYIAKTRGRTCRDRDYRPKLFTY